MAWVIGLANPTEIKRMQEAGWEIITNIPEIATFAKSLKVDGDIGVAIFVDCDVPDLLDMEGR